MPIIVDPHTPHPFLPSLGDPAAIDANRALHQDIRPLEIAIINLMADKRTTEKQLARWLGQTPIQVKLTFFTTDDYIQGIHAGRQSKNTSPEHIRKFYKGFSDIKNQKFDGLIVTGTNALQPFVEGEVFWPAVQEVLEWSKTNVLSSCFLCWGAKAALKHFHDIDSHKSDHKYLGLFEHRLVSDRTGILRGFPDIFPIPVARWKTPDPEAVRNCKAIEVVATTEQTGPSIMIESRPYGIGEQHYPWRFYLMPHPEYETDTIKIEYERDAGRVAGVVFPENYFPDNDPNRKPVNTWRHTANIYANWIHAIYEATPFDIKHLPTLLSIAS